jgi:membrane fusion protein, multidrug efflux system
LSNAYGGMSYPYRLWPAVLALLALAGCREEIEQQEEIRPVKAIVVRQVPDVRRLTFSGTIKARVESSLGFRVPGKIIERRANTGDIVQAGQVLARLDVTDLKLAETSARAAVAAAKTRLEVARLALERARSLLPNGHIPQSTVDVRLLDYDSARSALDAAESAAQQAANASGYAELKPEKTGIITAVQAEPGQVVAAGMPVFILAEKEEVEAEIFVPEDNVTRLSPGQEASVSLWSDPAVAASARIREIAGAADPQSRTYRVRLTADHATAAMRLGMTAVVKIELMGSGSAIAVPVTALVPQGAGFAVFVASKESGRVHLVPVSAGALEDASVRVTGIGDGAIVVTGGVQFLKEGMKVRLPHDVMHTALAAQADPQTR